MNFLMLAAKSGLTFHEYGSVEWLSDLRVLLVVGWLLLAALPAWDFCRWYVSHVTKGHAVAGEMCKLHLRPLGSCPPGSHGEEDGDGPA